LPRYPIREAARRAGIHPQTLRVYERRDLLHPVRTEGGKRLFSDADIDRAVRIRQVTDDNIPLAAARRVLRLEDLLQTAIDRIQTLEDQNRRLSTRLLART
jgi:MerR family transcriptional regulator/heat shock protein HspR